MKFDSEKHHRRSIRLKGYDYSQPGYYSVTICSRNRQCIFEDIINDVGAGLAPAQLNVTLSPQKNSFPNENKTIFQLTEIGYIINKNWKAIPNLYKNIDIDEFVIMPNHLHGIIIISRYYKRATARIAPTLGQIIGSFKSKCVVEYLKFIRENNLNAIGNMWHRNYYDHIIRNDKELNEIRKYIKNNPSNWAKDENNPINIK